MPTATGDSTGRAFPVVIGIASTGRSGVLARTIGHLASLADRPEHLVVSLVGSDDLDSGLLPGLPFPFRVLTGRKGSCVQRNAILDVAGEAGAVLFLDDDFLIADGYVSALRRLFLEHPEVVMATGRVIEDGIHGPGFDHVQGLARLASAPAPQPGPTLSEVYSVYGCNMAIRMSALVSRPERFDEALPLYGWLEDMDLSRRMARQGRIVRDESLIGVHLGTKTGRSPGLNLGYSQIANPVYMIRKGSVRPGVVLRIMARNILANMAHSLKPEPWIDRRGRLRGNALALFDLLRGRCSPSRVLDFGARGTARKT